MTPPSIPLVRGEIFPLRSDTNLVISTVGSV